MSDALLSAHAAATWFLVGRIRTVQVVHDPLFARVGERAHRAYHAEHVRRVTWLVAPALGVELLWAVALVVAPPAGVDGTLALAGLVLVGVVWAATAALQVPLPARLAAGYDERAQRRLVATNRARTVAWSARGAIALALLA